MSKRSFFIKHNKIGLLFFPPEEKIEDVSESDVKLDFCVTPEEIYKF